MTQAETKERSALDVLREAIIAAYVRFRYLGPLPKEKADV